MIWIIYLFEVISY